MKFRAPLAALLALAAVFFFRADLAFASDQALAGAINKAGRQRMLSQRIVKAYVQVGQGITPNVSVQQLRHAVSTFDMQLGYLKKFAPDERIGKSVMRLETLWRPFKAAATGTVNRNGAERLLAMDDELVRAAHELTLELQSRSGSPVGRLVGVAGRQRMLSQRLAKLYLLRAWGIESSFAQREMGSVRTEFDGALATLRAAPENTAMIRRELDAVAMQWEWFQNALEQSGAASYGLIVVSASEAILSSMEVVTGLYEQLSVP